MYVWLWRRLPGPLPLRVLLALLALAAVVALRVLVVFPRVDDLLRLTVETDFAPIYDRVRDLPKIAVDAIVPEDDVVTHGTQEYARSKTG